MMMKREDIMNGRVFYRSREWHEKRREVYADSARRNRGQAVCARGPHYDRLPSASQTRTSSVAGIRIGHGQPRTPL
jgi:hypothetical protein